MSKHMKRLATPRTNRIHRKEHVWTIRGEPGPHPLSHSIPLGIIIRDYLGLCDTYREAKRIISSGDILVDGQPRKRHKYPCGLMDVITIPKMKKYYRILYDQKGKLVLVDISEKDASWKLCRIEDKTTCRGNKTQLNFHDGRTKLVKKDEYKTGDVIKFSFKDNKMGDVYPFDIGTTTMIIGGRHIGQIATIKEIQQVASSKPNLALLKGDIEFSTITHYVFPIGKTKPTITLPEVKIR